MTVDLYGNFQAEDVSRWALMSFKIQSLRKAKNHQFIFSKIINLITLQRNPILNLESPNFWYILFISIKS